MGEIRIFAGYYAPRNWAFCDGQLVNVSEHQALYALYGTRYGGNGVSDFGLPDFRGRLPVQAGQGPGLSNNYLLGQKGGVEEVALTTGAMPSHTHPMQASLNAPESVNPGDHILGTLNINLYEPGSDVSSKVELHPQVIAETGESLPHTNMMPFVCINFIVALTGIFPPRN